MVVLRRGYVKGFTIVELLIVIVVIGILAAIVIVAYNGVQDRARASSVSSALSQAAKKIAVWQVDYPSTSPTCTQFGTELGSTDFDCSLTIGSVAYQYTAGTNGAYCITATNGTTSYYLNTTTATKPTAGGCAGHGVGGVAAITNLATNPSVETNTTGLAGPNGSTVARDTTRFKYGVASLRVTMPAAGSGQVGATIHSSALPVVLQPNTTYTVSCDVYVPSATVNVYMNAQGAVTGLTNQPGYIATAKDAWVRISNTFTTTASGSVVIYILDQAATATAGTQFWVDGIMITSGTGTYTYADGDSPNWAWNGTANNSTSVGPPI